MAFSNEDLITLHRATHTCLDLLLNHASALRPELWTRPVEGFGHPSLRAQFAHVLATEEWWMRALQHMPARRWDPESFNSTDALAAAKASVASETASYVNRLSIDQLNREIDTCLPEWVGPKRSPACIILHIVTHAFHHKGQIAAMLRLLGHPAPDTDLQR